MALIEKAADLSPTGNLYTASTTVPGKLCVVPYPRLDLTTLVQPRDLSTYASNHTFDFPQCYHLLPSTINFSNLNGIDDGNPAFVCAQDVGCDFRICISSAFRNPQVVSQWYTTREEQQIETSPATTPPNTPTDHSEDENVDMAIRLTVMPMLDARPSKPPKPIRFSA
ncbi:hypothetical protein NMY22_g6426 [Coprinellus aureogranulatus]|nr:hypothetical protein NMY22_g6426 [Coprinellus aureogranulatus]